MVEITCNKCNKPISEENKVRQTGAYGYRNICKPCRNKASRESSKKKSEALKLYRSFWT